MTINTINLGSAPNDDTGDAPRTAGAIINANFTDSANAASKLVGTATGEIPTSDNLDMVGAAENYTSNNLNPNVFGGIASNRILALGYAHNTGTAYFLLPTLSPSGAASITVSNTFSVYGANSVLIASGNVPVLVSGTLGASLIQVAGISLAQGEPLTLRTDSASSKITVNP